MDPAQLPSGGIPWILAAPAFIFLVGVAIAVVKWVALRADKKIEEAEARVVLANASKENLRLEYEKKLEEARLREEAKDQEIQGQLRELLDAAYSAKYGRPPRPAEPPPGITRRKQSTKELLAEAREVTGRFRREDLMDDTQGL